MLWPLKAKWACPCGNKQVVIHNENTGQDSRITLLERLRREIHEFPITMGWCKKVNFDVPTTAAFHTCPDSASSDDRSEHRSENEDGASTSDDDSAVGVAIPSYAAQGNFLEVKEIKVSFFLTAKITLKVMGKALKESRKKRRIKFLKSVCLRARRPSRRVSSLSSFAASEVFRGEAMMCCL